MKEFRVQNIHGDLIGKIQLTDEWVDSITKVREALLLIPLIYKPSVELLAFTLSPQPAREAVPEGPIDFRDLTQVVSFKDFTYDHTYKIQEKTLLQPQLEAKGYTDCQWGPGETDSFGPLTRVCKARDQDGHLIHFVYG